MVDKHWISAEGNSIHYDYAGYVREHRPMYGHLLRAPSWRLAGGSLSLLAVGMLIWWWQATALDDPHSIVSSLPRHHWGRQVSELYFDGVPVRLYVPPSGTSSGAGIVYFHGGGWQRGSAEGYHEVTKWFCTELGMTVASVDYHLAPRHVFPAAVDDCEAATRHFLSVADQYGVDPRRVAVMGDSSGGNLAAAVSLRLRDKRVAPPLKAQVLIYPATQALDLRLPSYLSHQTPPGLSAGDMAKFWLDYAVGSDKHTQSMLKGTHVSPSTRERLVKYLDHGAAAVDMPLGETENNLTWEHLEPILTNPYFSPGLANDLSDLPRALVLTAGRDPLHDDGQLFARRLNSSGNDVVYRDHPTASHGIFRHFEVRETQEMFKEIKEFLVLYL